MKRHLFSIISYGILVVVFILWIVFGIPNKNHLEYLTVMAAVASGIFAIRRFRLSNTLNKVQIITSKLETSEAVITVNAFIEKCEADKTPISKQNVEEDKNLYKSMNFLLGYFDDLAVGINEGIIDKSLAYKLIGEYYCKTYGKVKPYIEDINTDRKPVYTSAKELYEKWEKY